MNYQPTSHLLEQERAKTVEIAEKLVRDPDTGSDFVNGYNEAVADMITAIEARDN